MAQKPSPPKDSSELERQIAELQKSPDTPGNREEVARLQGELAALGKPPLPEAKSNEAWERVQLARHPQRPYTLDYIEMLFTGFMELHGDRRFGDDLAMVCGLARFEGQPVMVIGQQKGRDTKQKVARNFGMPQPEGYRKALRLMQFAEKFRLPVITFVDTQGAYPGLGAEERGQAEAIAYNLKEIPKLRIPIIAVIHGEGGSGGALAIAIGDKVLMLQNAVYSVIAPESCSSILWRDWNHKEEAALILKLTAEDLLGFGIVDEVAPEPPGGAHTDPKAAAELLRPLIASSLEEFKSLPTEDLLKRRHERLRRLATFVAG
ncbi:MAG: acetyl-CoA carboxylase carboxyltransferase subunit alpha [Acidobacteriota bacterium]|nr:acetyl-CoA carboxylase carboxyltransferase subunit alpha [Acidobacteriota bacterium]